ncbi:hypothetical protein Y032_0035g3055 [Ancylostoma ceylanicum]|uniref:Uncharacterized protein n=1 Tax=Ancylostoma ceylanicum TaxID=53326 RepID=A0A016UKM8_9BILA|nr:hypothetical protein Y032_0035g3055 [Ancylostoma ceylanicum]
MIPVSAPEKQVNTICGLIVTVADTSIKIGAMRGQHFIFQLAFVFFNEVVTVSQKLPGRNHMGNHMASDLGVDSVLERKR